MATRQNTIKVFLQLEAQNFNSALGQIQAQVKNAFGNMGGIVNKNLGSNAFQTAGWLKVFDIIEAAGSAAFGAIKQQISDAVELQTTLIGQAASYQQLLKLSFADAKGLASQANQAFVQKSIGLPFDEFGKSLRAALGDDLLGALYNASDVAGSIDKSASILSRLQVLIGGTSGINMRQGVSLVTDLLSGNASKVKNQEAFRNNPILSRVFDEILVGIGGDNAFNKLSKKDRVSKVIEPLSQAISDEVLSAYSTTAGGFIGRIQQGLFGQEGLFSFSRNLVFNLPNTSLLDSITGLLGELTSILTSLLPVIKGILDPLAIAFKTLIDGTTLILKPVSAVLSILGILEPAIYGLSAALSALFYIGIAKYSLGALGGLGGMLKGGGAAAKTLTPLSAMLGGGGAVASGGLDLLSLPLIGSQLNAILVLIKSFSFAGIASGFASIIPLITGGLTFVWGLLTGIGAVIAGLGAPILAGVAIVVGAGFLIWKYWKPIQDFFSGFFGQMGKDLEPLLSKFQWFADLIKSIGDGFNFLGSGLSSLVGKIGGFATTQANTPGAIDAGANFYDGIKGFFSNIGKFFHFSEGNAGLFDALVKEKSSMPSGAFPAIANTSEMILNRAQQGNLASAFNARGGGATLNYSPTFNISHNVDAEEIARISVQAVNNWWKNSQSEYSY